MPVCAKTNCNVTDKNPDWIECRGICGKIFHPIYIGLSRTAEIHLNEYLHNFSYYCNECKNISFSHIMMAIKCNNEQIQDLAQTVQVLKHDSNTNLKPNIETQLQNSIQIISNIDRYNVENKFNFKNTDKSIKNIKTILEDKVNVSDLSNLFLNYNKDILDSLSSKCNVNDFSSNFDDLKLLLQSQYQNISSSLAGVSTKIDNFAVGLNTQTDNVEDIKGELTSVNDELTATKLVVVDILEELKLISIKTDNLCTNKSHLVDNNISLQQELFNSNLTLSEQNTKSIEHKHNNLLKKNLDKKHQGEKIASIKRKPSKYKQQKNLKKSSSGKKIEKINKVNCETNSKSSINVPDCDNCSSLIVPDLPVIEVPDLTIVQSNFSSSSLNVPISTTIQVPDLPIVQSNFTNMSSINVTNSLLIPAEPKLMAAGKFNCIFLTNLKYNTDVETVKNFVRTKLEKDVSVKKLKNSNTDKSYDSFKIFTESDSIFETLLSAGFWPEGIKAFENRTQNRNFQYQRTMKNRRKN